MRAYQQVSVQTKVKTQKLATEASLRPVRTVLALLEGPGHSCGVAHVARRLRRPDKGFSELSEWPCVEKSTLVNPARRLRGGERPMQIRRFGGFCDRPWHGRRLVDSYDSSGMMSECVPFAHFRLRS
jgi:hypothetical protein